MVRPLRKLSRSLRALRFEDLEQRALLSIESPILAMPPDAVDDAYTLPEDSAIVKGPVDGLLANDEGAASALLVSGPNHGVLFLNPSGAFAYQPNADFDGVDSFVYMVGNGSDTATVTLNVINNDAVEAVDDNYAAEQNVSLVIDAGSGLLDNDLGIAFASLISGPDHGTVALFADGSFAYYPAEDYTGSDSFVYRGSNNGDSDLATVNITVENTAPDAADDAYSTDEDTLLIVAADGVLGNDSDPNGDPLSAVLVEDPAHGTLALGADGSFEYTPDADYNGIDTFSYKANDGALDSNVAVVTITVGAVNDAPAAVEDAYATDEDVPLSIAATGVLGNDSDVDSDPLTAVLVDGPTHGTLVLGADGSLLYTPDANYNGSDAFSYKASDGVLESNAATVTITVAAVNDAPVALDDAYATDEDVPLSIAAAGVLGNDTDAEGDSLSAVLVDGPVYGTLALKADGSFEYAPDADYNGIDTFSYKANDGLLDSNVAVVTITVGAVNDAPAAVEDAYATDEDVPLSIAAAGVLGNDTDVEGDSLSAVLVDGPVYGTLALGADGSFEYAPDADYNGIDTFSYKANDGLLDSNVAVVTITVGAVNDAPAAVEDAYATDEDVPLSIAAAGVLGNDTDVEGDSLSAVLVDGPVYGTLALGADGSFEYAPDADYNGIDTFSYKANDGLLDSNVAVVTITVGAVNDAPAAVEDAYATDEDVPLSIAAAGVLGNDTDVEGDSLSAVLVDGPVYGTLALGADGSFEYAPDADYNGIDTFSYKANDGALDSNVAVVTITVGAVNDAPAAVEDAYATDEDVPLSIAAAGVLGNDTDVEGDSLSAVLVDGPVYGTLALGADGSFVYTPDADYNGIDTFSYKANDGALDSNVAVVTITVGAVNDAPAAVEDAYATDEDVPLSIAAAGVLGNDTDVEGDSLSAVLVDGPVYGTLALGADGSFEYAPDADYNGIDTFSYKANDGALDSNVAVVTITVGAVNDAPAAVEDAYATDEDVPLSIAAAGVLGNDTDVEGDSLSAVLVDGPVYGTLALGADGSFEYAPDADYNGIDTFSYKANDGALDSNVAVVTITVGAVNDAPAAVEDAYATDEDVPLSIAAAGVLGNDTDVEGDSLSAVLVDGPVYGTLALGADGSFEYAPDADYNGIDTFSYKANDGALDSNVAVVTITVGAVNDAPAAVEDAYATDEDVPLSIAAAGVLGNDTDVEGDSLSAVLVDGPVYGTLALGADGSFEYAPDADYNGIDTFSYKANDGALDSNVAVVTITVGAVNDAPAAVEDAYATDEDVPLSIAAAGVLGNDTDVEGDSLSAVLVDGPVYGTLALGADGSFEYAPDADYNGIDTFSYKANDGALDSNVAVVTITVGAVNDAPAAVEDAYATDEDVPLSIAAAGVLGNDTDVEGDSLSAVLVDGPVYGTLALGADGSFEYTPDADYNGIDTFSYKANDGALDSNVAVVTITVAAVNHPLDAVDDSFTTTEGEALLVPAPGVLDNDIDPDGDGVVSVVVLPLHGSLILLPDGGLGYLASPGFVGTDAFTYSLSDGESEPDYATVTLIVNPREATPPLAVDDEAATDEETPVVIAVLANDSDADGDPLVVSVVSDPPHGAVTVNADNTVAYTPDADYFGVDSFTYQASDGSQDSNTATVLITVNPVNDAPLAAPDEYTAVSGETLQVLMPGFLGNDWDIDGDTVSFVSISDLPDHYRTFTWSQTGQFGYRSAAGFVGDDTFSYEIQDGHGGVATGTVTIHVAAAELSPVSRSSAVRSAALKSVALEMPASTYFADDLESQISVLAQDLITRTRAAAAQKLAARAAQSADAVMRVWS